MRSIHFRVEDDLYRRIQEEAEQQDLSIASFARVATVARTRLWAVRRGAAWADLEAWGEAMEIIQDIERRDVAARAKLGRERRMGPTFSDKLKREQPAPPSEYGPRGAPGGGPVGLGSGNSSDLRGTVRELARWAPKVRTCSSVGDQLCVASRVASPPASVASRRG